MCRGIFWHFRILERFEIKGWQDDECLSMYIITTIPHGKCLERYLRTCCFYIRNLTGLLRSFVQFLIRQQLVRKYHTPALSMKCSLCITLLPVLYVFWRNNMVSAVENTAWKPLETRFLWKRDFRDSKFQNLPRCLGPNKLVPLMQVPKPPIIHYQPAT